MDGIAHALKVVVAVVAAIVVAVPAPARAEPDPEPGMVTAKPSDVCGFVRADFTNADKAIAAHIQVSRNGKPLLLSPNGFVGAGRSATLHEVAAKGDLLRFAWLVNGGATESLEHVHATPAGCEEPDVSLSFVDDCGLYFTVVMDNRGSAPADVLLDAPALHHAPIPVPVGKATVTTLGTAGSTVRLSMRNPGGTDSEVDSLSRGPECGVPWPKSPTAYFLPGCDNVKVVFIAVQIKGLMIVYRNSRPALEDTVDGDMHEWTVTAAPGDVVTIDDPPLATHVHAPPAGCPTALAAASAGPSRVSSRPRPQSPAEQTPPTASLAAPASPTRSTPAPVAVGLPGEPMRPASFPFAGLGISLAVVLAAVGLVLRRTSLRRRLTWAEASLAVAGAVAVTITGSLPGMSVRWTAHADPGTHTLREDVAR